MKVLLTPLARKHLREIFRYIRKSSPQNAVLVRGRIADFLTLLSSVPSIGKPGRVESTREYLVPHTSHLVIYEVKEHHIDVVAILRKSRYWRNLNDLSDGSE